MLFFRGTMKLFFRDIIKLRYVFWEWDLVQDPFIIISVSYFFTLICLTQLDEYNGTKFHETETHSHLRLGLTYT